MKGLRYGINICYDTQFADAAAHIAADVVAQVPLMEAGLVIARIPTPPR